MMIRRRRLRTTMIRVYRRLNRASKLYILLRNRADSLQSRSSGRSQGLSSDM